MGASKEAKANGEPCVACDEIKAKVKALRAQRRKLAIEAGSWAGPLGQERPRRQDLGTDKKGR